MRKILFGVKHSQALENVLSIAKYLDSNNENYSLGVISFTRLGSEELKKINRFNIEIIKLPEKFFIRRDEKKTRIKSFVKLLRFNKYLKTIEKEIIRNDTLIVSPGGFLLDHLLAFFASKNMQSYVLQSGFISVNEKKQESKNLFSNILSIFFNTFKIRRYLKEGDLVPINLTFNNDYSVFLNNLSDESKIALTVGSPRFSYNKVTDDYKSSGVLYLGSSALYENNQALHEMIKLQVVDLTKYLTLKNIKLSFRAHPRDPYDWSTYLKNYDINILDKNEDLEKQLNNHKFIVSERSTVVIQAILQSKLGFWIHRDLKRIYNYEFIRCENEELLVETIESCNNDIEEYKKMHQNQLTIVRNKILSSYGDDACKNILNILDSNINKLK
jgi:aromatic ring-opening dioxygenase LigB subunit